MKQNRNYVSKIFKNVPLLALSFLILFYAVVSPFDKSQDQIIENVYNPMFYLRAINTERKVIFNSQKIEKFKDSDNLSETQKKNLEYILIIQKFITNVLELEGEKTYTKIYDTKNKPIAYNLTVCPPLSLTPVRWRFPIVGLFPYKGFFDENKALADVKKWEDLGFETHLRNVAAYSTLGWFKDPIFSPMLKYNIGSLADIIIHERTHNTIYLKDQMEFNESLASFIGENGAQLFLKTQFGEDSPEYKIYESIKHDSEIFNQFINDLYDELNTLYKSDKEKAVKEKLKEEIISKYKERYRKLPFELEGYITYIESLNLNNAVIISYKTYATDMSKFEEVYKILDMDLPRFIRVMKQIPKGKDGFEYMDEFIKHQKSFE